MTPPDRIRLTGKEVYRILRDNLAPREDEYVVLVAKKVADSPFALLVGIILSQNTNDVNSIRALRQLAERIGLSPVEVLRAPEEVLEEAIRPAGLYRQKARTIKELARRLMEVGGEEYLSREDPWRLREWLTSIPGIGKKTADVFLALARGVPVFAVDTHAFRIAKRWGLVRDKASYDEVSRAFLEFFGEEDVDEAHRLIIALGRRYCKARKPRCSSCPLREYCPYALQQSQSRSRRGRGGVWTSSGT